MNTSIDVRRCAAAFQEKYFPYDTDKKDTLETGLQILEEISQLWKTHDDFDAPLCNLIPTNISNRPLLDQGDLSFLLDLLMGTTRWWQIAEEEWKAQDFLYFPLVWAFRLDLKRLYTSLEVRDLTALQTLRFEHNLWIRYHGQGFVEIPDVHMFGWRLREWGVTVAFRVGRLEDMTHEDLQLICACMLINATSPHNLPQQHDLELGFRIIQQTSSIWSQVKETEEICQTLTAYISAHPPPYQHSLNLLIGTLAGHEDWAQLDKQAVSSGQFRVSAAMLILKVSPREFARGWRGGKTTEEILEGIEGEIGVLLEEEAFTRPYFEELVKWLYGWGERLRP